MALTYHTYRYHPWEINPDELKHQYYVQPLPNHPNRLVLGMLEQDTQPSKQLDSTKRLDVTTIDRNFAKRYFVQYTNFNTLVPGSLIQADKLPKGKWKEIKKPRTKFYRITFTDHYQQNFPFPPDFFLVANNPFTTQDDFLINRALPALKAIYPKMPTLPFLDTWIPNALGIKFNLYYFKGNFAELNEDKTKFIPFSTTHLSIRDFSGQQPPTGLTAWERSTNSLYCKSTTPDGTYSFILAILDAQNNEKEYVVLENILTRATVPL